MLPRKKPSALAAVLAIIGVVFVIIAAAVVAPLLTLLAGMFVGWILELFTGDYVVQAFHAIGLTGVQGDDLPKVFGLLALVGALFKATVNTSKTKKTDE